MTIKDVEKITGLTAKSIRYYEDKGLVSVERNEENAYRNYTEENVKRFKWIKLYRYLDFSVEEIKELLDMEGELLSDKLEEKMDAYDNHISDWTAKKDILASLMKDNGTADVDEYEEVVEFWESEEMDELREELKDAGTPSLSLAIWNTLIFGAPICMLFVNIARELWSAVQFNAIIAVISTVILTASWKHYFEERKYHKKRVQEKGKGQAIIWPLMLVVLVFVFAGLIGVLVFAEKIFAPKEWLFYEHSQILSVVMIFFMVFAVVAIIFDIARKWLHLNMEKLDLEYLDVIYKYPVQSIVVWVIVMYICLTSVTFVTEDSIIRHTPFCPQGEVYAYEDVTKVEAKFGDRNFAIAEYKRKGSFSYTVYVKDQKIVFSVPSVNEDIERYNEHSYLELEEFDAKLMELGVTKESSDKNYNYCDFDKEYVDRFLKIINNK